MSPVYAIKDWNEVFEDRRSREVARLQFLPCRVLDSKSDAYASLVAQDGGVEAYGVFWALVLVAARCPVRGILADDRGVLTPLRMSVKARIPLPIVERSIPLLSSPDVGWLVEVPSAASAGHQRVISGASAGCRQSADVPPTCRRRSADESSTPADGLSKNADEVPTKPPSTAERARDTTQQNTTATATATGDTTEPRRAAAGAAVVLSDEDVRERAVWLRRRPEWLGESKRWFSPAVVDEFSADVRVTEELVRKAYAEGRSARSLDNPAGVVIKYLRAMAKGELTHV